VSELCRELGVSRDCGHKWIRRYRDAGRELAAIQERSRRPRRCPTAVEDGVEDAIAAGRKEKPKWRR
jgi:transposase